MMQLIAPVLLYICVAHYTYINRYNIPPSPTRRVQVAQPLSQLTTICFALNFKLYPWQQIFYIVYVTS